MRTLLNERKIQEALEILLGQTADPQLRIRYCVECQQLVNCGDKKYEEHYATVHPDCRLSFSCELCSWQRVVQVIDGPVDNYYAHLKTHFPQPDMPSEVNKQRHSFIFIDFLETLTSAVKVFT